MDCEYLETHSLVAPLCACHTDLAHLRTSRMGQPAASTARPFLLDPVSREQRRHHLSTRPRERRCHDHVKVPRGLSERNSGRTDHVNEGNPS